MEIRSDLDTEEAFSLLVDAVTSHVEGDEALDEEDREFLRTIVYWTIEEKEHLLNYIGAIGRETAEETDD